MQINKTKQLTIQKNANHPQSKQIKHQSTIQIKTLKSTNTINKENKTNGLQKQANHQTDNKLIKQTSQTRKY